ncbi:hypothetical protein LTR37_020023 [Vermiconidia calcicola]|uniref:Uncharacterized protein n=1 Tax=Vermiconidia calcicola TaxID=1690605 RepID=A0ACC3MEC6_9PEZI|nr:hypothetical protein LTR37_020023 [Vermiconidia calcicola]
MEPLVSRAFARLAPRAHGSLLDTGRANWTCSSCRVTPAIKRGRRQFTTTSIARVKEKQQFSATTSADNSYTQPAADVSQDITQVEQNHFDRVESESKEKQARSPWMREGSEKPPVARNRSAGAMTKGKLLTTPSRMLKLILPLTTRDANQDRKDVEPLALLVHPQQPLSYLERLIQSELPMMADGNKERVPSITFRAEDATEEDLGSGKSAVDEMENAEEPLESADETIENAEETMIDGKLEKPSNIHSEEEAELPAHPHPQTGPPPTDDSHPNFVRWSPSTEIGDFIRDAARGKEFAVDIEGAPPIYVGVPSFEDRTFYLRMRLKKVSKTISSMADVKRECDELAQLSGQRVAQSGFAGLIGWWALVYYLTFKTDLGWDVMEPVTYLVGLTGLIGGYMWFLYHNREASYRSAMNLTVSRRQSKLYEQKGFNLPKWEFLMGEGNRLRREVRMVADEYDVDWDEQKDEVDEKASEALRRNRKKNGKKGKGKKEDKEEDDDED